jgi:hypothetical protein
MHASCGGIYRQLIQGTPPLRRKTNSAAPEQFQLLHTFLVCAARFVHAAVELHQIDGRDALLRVQCVNMYVLVGVRDSMSQCITLSDGLHAVQGLYVFVYIQTCVAYMICQS